MQARFHLCTTTSGLAKTSKLYILSGLLLMVASCHGGSSNSGVPGGGNSAQGPIRLFPNDVNTGKISIADSRKLEISPTYNGVDYTQGFSEYSVKIDASANATGANNAGGSFSGGNNMRQVADTSPGTLIFIFSENEGSGNVLQGQLVLSIPASGVDDKAHTRTGTVESGTALYYTAQGTTAGRTKLDLNGAAVTVTWD